MPRDWLQIDFVSTKAQKASTKPCEDGGGATGPRLCIEAGSWRRMVGILRLGSVPEAVCLAAGDQETRFCFTCMGGGRCITANISEKEGVSVK